MASSGCFSGGAGPFIHLPCAPSESHYLTGALSPQQHHNVLARCQKNKRIEIRRICVSYIVAEGTVHGSL